MTESLSDQRRVARNAGILLLRQLFVTAVGVVVIGLIARHLGPEDLGRFEYAFALVLGFSGLASFGLRAVTVRTVAQQSQPLADYLGLMLSLRLILSLVAWPVVIVCAYYLANGSTLVGLVAIASLTLPVNALGTTLRDVLQGLERFDVEALTSVVVRVVTMIGALVAIYLDYGVVAIVAVYSGGALFGLLVPAVAMQRAGHRFGFRWSMPDAVRELKHAAPFGAHGVVALLMWEVNPVLIEALSTMAMVGIFAAGTRLLMPLEMIPDSVSDALTPAVARAWVKDGAGSGELIGRAFYALMVIGVPVAVGGALCADQLIELIFGSQFQQAGTILMILVIVLPLEFLSIPAANALGAIHQQNRMFWIGCGGAAVNLIGSFALIPSHGAVGCAWASAATTVFCCVAYLLLLSRHCRLWVDYRGYAKLAVANGLMAAAVYVTLPYGVVLAVPVGGAVYVAVMLGLRAVSVKMLVDMLRPQPSDAAEETE